MLHVQEEFLVAIENHGLISVAQPHDRIGVLLRTAPDAQQHNKATGAIDKNMYRT